MRRFLASDCLLGSLVCFFFKRGNGICSALLSEELASSLLESSFELTDFSASAIIFFVSSLIVCDSLSSEVSSSLLEEGRNESSSEGMTVDVCREKDINGEMYDKYE